MSLMRGVEGAFSIVRAAKNGFLTVSDNRGRIVGEVRSDFRCVCDLAARRAGGTRMDLVSGNWFAWVAAGLPVVVVVRAASLARFKPATPEPDRAR